jgi:hypothetical protein
MRLPNDYFANTERASLRQFDRPKLSGDQRPKLARKLAPQLHSGQSFA